MGARSTVAARNKGALQSSLSKTEQQQQVQLVHVAGIQVSGLDAALYIAPPGPGTS